MATAACNFNAVDFDNPHHFGAFSSARNSVLLVVIININAWKMTSDADAEPLYVVGLYAAFSFVCVMLLVLLLYAACARKFRLNWFEKNLLENADVSKSNSNRSRGRLHEAVFKNSETHYSSPVASLELDLQRESCQSDETSTDNLVPISPSSTGSYQFPTFTGPVPLVSNEKQIVLTTSSAVAMRPRVSSMQSKLDHTKIDTSLYQKEPPAEPENVMGTVHVSFAYDPVSGLLTVRLVEAQDLQARDFSGTADPYAKIRLLPDRTNVWQTRIHKKTLNPVFDEDFVFEVQPATLERHVLEILLYDFDAYSRHYSIGSVQLPLSDFDLSEKVSVWRPLAQHVPDDPKVNVGELMVSLAYLPSAERLTVIVIKARNLKVVDVSRNSSDPYVKVSLVQDKKKLKKRKTGVHRSTLSPVFNEALTFDIDKETLRKCTLDFCVMHDSLVGTSEPLGVCRVGRTKDCRQEERHFFHEMLHSKTASAKWLTLSDPQIH